MAWKDLSRRIKQQVAEFLEIPAEVILDLPKVILLGNLQLVVENHRGILKYNPELIHINVSEGEVVIQGKDLKLRSVLPEEIFVEGRIKSIVLGGNK